LESFHSIRFTRRDTAIKLALLKRRFQKMQHLLGCAVALMLLFAGPVFAQTADESAISKLLHITFDKAESPPIIAPVVVAGNHAIAGWTQGDMGGRALLRKNADGWQLILCAGDGIRSRDSLAKVGIPSQDAAALERDLAAAEGKLPPQQVAMFSKFEGMLMMDGSGNHPQVDHSPRAKHGH
jgi:hypothetical protein